MMRAGIQRMLIIGLTIAVGCAAPNEAPLETRKVTDPAVPELTSNYAWWNAAWTWCSNGCGFCPANGRCSDTDSSIPCNCTGHCDPQGSCTYIFDWGTGGPATGKWWDTDLSVAEWTPVEVPHDSKLIARGVYAWGYMPTFVDQITNKTFQFLHLHPTDQNGHDAKYAWAIGTIYPGGTVVGLSGGNSCDTGNGSLCNPPRTQYSSGSHLCVETPNGTYFRDAFPSSTAVFSGPVCSASDNQCGPNSYETACTGGACAGQGCCCPAARGAMSGSFFYCCSAGNHYGPLPGGGAGCVADQPGCSANDSQCSSSNAYGTACSGGACSSQGCCCPSARTCMSGSFLYCCNAGTHCGSLPGGGQGCLGDVGGIGAGCSPNCSGRNCGPDPNDCATSCGACASGWTCSSSGTCTPPSPTCPTGGYWYGAGQYCYFQPGMANTVASHLYSCSAPGSAAADLGNCGEGCHGMPPGYNDLCYSAYCPTGGWWYGAGLYCGRAGGMSNANPDIVYYCGGPGAKASINRVCGGACVVAPPGYNDHC
jgi:hypothetical protein